MLRVRAGTNGPVAGVTKELVNLPNIMLAGALIMAIRVYLSPRQAELAMGKNECMTKYTAHWHCQG